MLVFATLLAALSSTVRSRAALELENLALRHQIGVLQRSARKRPKLTPVDRLVWAWLSHIWSDWRSGLAIVQPETVLALHRKGFGLCAEHVRSLGGASPLPNQIEVKG